MERRNAKIATAAHASLYGALTVLFIILTVVNYGRKDFLSGLAAAFWLYYAIPSAAGLSSALLLIPCTFLMYEETDRAKLKKLPFGLTVASCGVVHTFLSLILSPAVKLMLSNDFFVNAFIYLWAVFFCIGLLSFIIVRSYISYLKKRGKSNERNMDKGR
jgi:hypothetical protein